jgi:hypothetical protein
MMPGIPKFRKENHPERARNKTGPIFSHLLNGYFLSPIKRNLECLNLTAGKMEALTRPGD